MGIGGCWIDDNNDPELGKGSEIEDGDAEDMESAIVQNQELMGWWMNFDNGFDYVALLLYIGGVALIGMQFDMAGQKEDEMYDWTIRTLL